MHFLVMREAKARLWREVVEVDVAGPRRECSTKAEAWRRGFGGTSGVGVSEATTVVRKGKALLVKRWRSNGRGWIKKFVGKGGRGGSGLDGICVFKGGWKLARSPRR